MPTSSKMLDAFALFEHPIKEDDVESYISSLIWLGQLAEACAIAKQMRDRPRIYQTMPNGHERDWARQAYSDRWHYWFGVYTVLSNITTRNASRAKRRHERKRSA